MSSDITIVTAFFDIGRGSWPAVVRGRVLPPYQHRTTETYLNYFSLLASIDNPMIIYTQDDLVDDIRKIRDLHGHSDKTEIVSFPKDTVFSHFNKDDLLNKIDSVMSSQEFISSVNEPWLPEYWNSKYVMINFMKSDFVCDAIEKNLIKTPLAAWIDFGYCRVAFSLPKSRKWNYNFDPDKIHMFNQFPINSLRPIEDIIKTGDVYIQGCHIVAGTKMWNELKSGIYKNIDKLLEMKYIDDDQTLLLMSYLDNTSAYELHKADPDDWFRIFKRYNLL